MLEVFRARWILPIASSPIRDGWLAVEGDRIAAFGGADSEPLGSPAEAFMDAAILPGLVNAHTHLELSWMRGQTAPAPSMPQWVESLMALRRTVDHEPVWPTVEAIREARAAGTSLVGDVTNTLASYSPLADSEMSAAIFHELLGFDVANATAVVADAHAHLAALPRIGRLRTFIAPHAPYSVSAELLRAIADGEQRRVTIHLGESAEEMEFLQSGTGAWRTLLTAFGVWSDTWTAPSCSPVEYIARHGLLNDRLLAVHCVQLGHDDLRRLADAGATVVTCPRSNRWTGAGVPPVERFYDSGVRVAVGTDSLGSVDDLNMFSELATLRELAPSIPARALLESATRHGADALGFGREMGTIEPGKRAELIAVALEKNENGADDVDDVEEYLVSGITPDLVRWLV
ncbi:MAG: amidohydrolase family protein [Acidobacteria bacterium]|nr:amidohydrolase family protein [Acidobacteriota bacterium]